MPCWLANKNFIYFYSRRMSHDKTHTVTVLDKKEMYN